MPSRIDSTTRPERHELAYRGYILKSRPQPTPQGRFLGFVAIACDVGGAQTQAAFTSDAPSFADPRDAVRAGLAAGMRWVDEHG